MSGEIKIKKSLGQHWLNDETTLKYIASTAPITKKDTVLEIGPGLGTLTKFLTPQAHQVIAVELDEVLAKTLLSKVKANNLTVVNESILDFDLTALPTNYIVVANIPYYLTGHLMRMLSDTNNPPSHISLLVQKEVAERIAATAGEMSIIAVAVQLEFEVELGEVVKAELFTPPPKVDSQMVILKKRQPLLFQNIDKNQFMRVVKAGFSNPRKKLRSSLSAGLALEKGKVDELLKKAQIDGNLRAQNLSLQQWHKLYEALM
jgi:16S rRNA (adenine1518-N6/adenine1519-N6)-dimethyltransferase